MTIYWFITHISKGMLEAHLNPDWNAPTRKLDLGCGPGIYAEGFHKAGYRVIGIDFSKHSIDYAKEQTLHNQSNIQYHYQNYLTIDYKEQFDIITLIYCDYATLSITDRHILLKKVYEALKPKGKFIFDVFTPLMRKPESHSWCYNEESGFWSPQPHLSLESVYQYEEDSMELRQTIVITEDTVHCYNIWERFFTKEELISELEPMGFSSYELYGDIAGKEFSDT